MGFLVIFFPFFSCLFRFGFCEAGSLDQTSLELCGVTKLFLERCNTPQWWAKVWILPKCTLVNQWVLWGKLIGAEMTQWQLHHLSPSQHRWQLVKAGNLGRIAHPVSGSTSWNPFQVTRLVSISSRSWSGVRVFAAWFASEGLSENKQQNSLFCVVKGVPLQVKDNSPRVKATHSNGSRHENICAFWWQTIAFFPRKDIFWDISLLCSRTPVTDISWALT